MPTNEPGVRIRPPHYAETRRCCDLVRANWGDEAADRCHDQLIEYWEGGGYAPVFVVAVDNKDEVIGFAAYQRTMLMKGSFDLIWLVIDEKHQGASVGKLLTEWRLAEIAALDGQMVKLVTQKPYYFAKFGFFKLHHLGNEWYLMLKLLTTKVDI
jgi:GNAT superfamily N-acetyltransferase